MTRRDLLASAVVASGCSAPEGSKGPESLDRALDTFHATDPEYDDGLSNHGPMGAEALEALGHAERITPWVDGYASRLEPLEKASPLSDVEQEAALGDVSLRARWVATYEELLGASDPASLVAAHFDRLAPGYAAAALHAPIRTGQALRGFQRHDSTQRRREVAQGLAYWAARHQPLPGEPGKNAVPGFGVVDALAEVPMVPSALRVSGGLIIDRLRVVAQVPEFATAVEKVDLDAAPIEAAITELACAAARIYLVEPNAEFVYLHAITGTSALRLMLPFLTPAQARSGLGYAFQSVAAIHATHGSKSGVPTATKDEPGADVASLASEAASDDDEHTIKLVEAALREYAIAPRAELLAAARNRL